VDEGQADLLAISSRPTSMSSTVPLAIGSIQDELASNGSSRLEVPRIDSQGRSVTSITASTKSGTVGGSDLSPATATELFGAKEEKQEIPIGVTATEQQAKKGLQGGAVESGILKDPRPTADRFYTAQ
jgi:hypothetical protein